MQSQDFKPVGVSVAPHPFTAARALHEFAPGVSVEEIVARVQPDPVLRRHAHVFLGGESVPRENWARVYPKPGVQLCIRMAPMGGGGGKNPLRTVLSIAVMAASPALAAGLTGALGLTASASVLGISAARLVTSGVGILGRLAMNALAPPARGRYGRGAKESPTLFLQGARNRAEPFSRVPRVLGRHRMVPPMGALPYTETVGNDQYMRLLFIWGYGPLEISDLKIGETPIAEFEGVEIETRQGYPEDDAITLYSNSVLQNDMQVPLTEAGGYVTRTTEADADEISVDITFPRGLFRLGETGKKSVTAEVEVQYSPAGADDWSAAAAGYKAIAAQALSFAKPQHYYRGGVVNTVQRIDRIVMDPASGVASAIRGPQFRMGLDIGSPEVPPVPAGMIAIARVDRRSSDADVIPAGRVRDERDPALFGAAIEDGADFLATAAVSAHTVNVAAGGIRFSGVSATAAQSSALRKSVSFRVPRGQYDVRVRRLTADATDDSIFDETYWTALRTVRYAAPVAMAGLAMTAVRIKATEQLNGVLDRFNGVVHSILPDWTGTEWAEQATSSPAALFRHVLQGAANARPLADSRIDLARLEEWHDACAAAGREFNAVIDYDVSVREVLHDVAAAGRASPALVDGKWSVTEDRAQSVPVQHFTPRNTYGFRGEKAFDDMPHALRMRFINRDKGWLQDEVLVFDDGYDAQTAVKYEAIDLHGVTSATQAWKEGRYHIATARLRPENYTFHADVEHIVCTRGDLVRFTHDVPLFGLASARVKSVTAGGGTVTGAVLDAKVLMEEGGSYALRFRLSDGSSLVKSVVTAAGETDTVSFTAPFPDSEGLAAGDLAMFGESGQESVELVVKAITPQGDLSAKITCVDAAPAVHTADTAEIPAFSAQITLPPEMRRPPAPVVAGVQSGDGALFRTAGGELLPAIEVTLAPVDYPLTLATHVQIRRPEETEWRPAQFSAGTGQVTVLGVEAGVRYDLRIVYRNAGGLTSAPAVVSNHLVGGATALPGDVQEFAVSILGETAHLSWAASREAHVSHYRVKFNGGDSGATWASAFDIVSRVSRAATSASVPALPGTWLIKAVGYDGRESAAAATAVSRVDRAPHYALVDVVDETGNFGLALSEDSENVAFDPEDRIVLDGALEGTYVFYDDVDLADVCTCFIAPAMTVAGVNPDNLVDGWGDVDIVDDWDGAADPATWGAQLQVRTTNDSPVGGATWTAWQDFIVGEYTARAIQFRLKLFSLVEGVSPAVSALDIDISMRRWSQGEANVMSYDTDEVESMGTQVVYPEEFFDYDAVSIMPHDMEAGDYYVINLRNAREINISFYDSSNSRVTRMFDYIAQGIGRKVTT